MDEFELAKKVMDSFKIELSALMDKYKFDIHSSDDYDGQDEYTGQTHYFKIGDFVWYNEPIIDILDEAIPIFQD